MTTDPFHILFDISLPLSPRTLRYQGDPSLTLTAGAHIDRGDPFTVSTLTLGLHTGTHLDFPSHFLKDDRDSSAFQPDRFLRQALVIDTGDVPVVSADCMDGAPVAAGDALLLRTSNSRRRLLHQDALREEGVVLSADAARWCVDAGVTMVGIDWLSVDGPDGGFPVHHILLEAGILVLEAIDLEKVPAGRYTLIALPLALQEAEASPVRALLLPPVHRDRR